MDSYPSTNAARRQATHKTALAANPETPRANAGDLAI